ncbi:MAG: peptidoglycan editing factor PgeF [Gammaproteobacteria bacterium]|nr:peptidoglycan editing factor PgeF [Gammaproteobacteria bacterium]
MSDELEFIAPLWPAPLNIRALSTTRFGGVSEGPYASFNLAQHVGDSAEHVSKNRQILMRQAEMPAEPLWLKQVHGTEVVNFAGSPAGEICADASITSQPGQVLTVMTADCLPLLICDAEGSHIAAVHAGWRGLLAGIIENTLDKLIESGAKRLIAWMGPAIGPESFEVGAEVRDQFGAHDARSDKAFRPAADEGKYLADLYQLARLRMEDYANVDVYGGDFCTYTESERFFSYRRDGETGRMASCIWLMDE